MQKQVGMIRTEWALMDSSQLYPEQYAKLHCKIICSICITVSKECS